MTDKFQEKLKSWAEKNQQKRSSLTAFIAIEKEVQESINNGYPATVIWQFLTEQGMYPAGYDSFRKHVNQRIKKQGATRTSPLPEKTQTQQAPEPKTRNKEDDEHEPVIVRTNFESKGFRHDPAGARLEDLV